MFLILLVLTALVLYIQSKPTLPFPFHEKYHHHLYNSYPRTSSRNQTYPVWPNAFNTTLLKIEKGISDRVQYTKLYYDWNKQKSRFVFYDHYYDTNKTWGPSNYEVLFTNGVFYHIYPLEQKCEVSPSKIPPVSPHFLAGTLYRGEQMFRGMYSELWEFVEGPLKGIRYYTRGLNLPREQLGKLSLDYDPRVPLRSTNQDGDPGETDYVDFIVGPQDVSHWTIPPYCMKDI